MFYCDPCARTKDWPITMFKSRGGCEICGKIAVCNETKSSELPLPPRQDDSKS